jgi:predicted Zn-dependent protease
MCFKWKIFWVASFALVVFFQACGLHSWEELLVSTADEKRMGREFDSLVRIGDKSVVRANESLFKPQTEAEKELFNYYQERAREVVAKISSKNFDALLTSEKLCRNNPDNVNEKVACNKNNFFEFNIIKSKTKNAFAVPGGYVYFYTAILKDFKSESELVSVFSHEVGHVVLHHSRDGMVKSAGASAVVGIFLGDGIGGLIGLLGANFWLLGNSRENESEADEMGFKYTNALGISSQGLSDFFARGLKSYDPDTKKCDEEKESSALDVFSTHPPSCERVLNNIKRMEAAKQDFPLDKNSSPSGKSFTELVKAAGI